MTSANDGQSGCIVLTLGFKCLFEAFERREQIIINASDQNEIPFVFVLCPQR